MSESESRNQKVSEFSHDHDSMFSTTELQLVKAARRSIWGSDFRYTSKYSQSSDSQIHLLLVKSDKVWCEFRKWIVTNWSNTHCSYSFWGSPEAAGFLPEPQSWRRCHIHWHRRPVSSWAKKEDHFIFFSWIFIRYCGQCMVTGDNSYWWRLRWHCVTPELWGIGISNRSSSFLLGKMTTLK